MTDNLDQAREKWTTSRAKLIEDILKLEDWKQRTKLMNQITKKGFRWFVTNNKSIGKINLPDA
jgi:hypothetical protein